MDYKIKLPKVLALAVLLSTTSVNAECYLRSATVVSGTPKVQRVSDVKETKLPYNGLRKCIAQMRIQVNNEWLNAEGEGIAETDGQACSDARELAQARFLIPVDNPVVNAESSMVCNEAPPTRIREKIRVGDYVLESEVGVFHSKPKPFRYQGSQCKWFTYKEIHLGKPVGFAGIMCIMQSQWQVVDLF